MSTIRQTAPLPSSTPFLKIFISYSQQDISIVKELYDRLILEGLYDIYWDQVLKPGDEWQDTLTKKLKEADVVLFCVSRNSNTSQYVQNELNLAIVSSKEHILIPVRLDDSPVPQRLATIQWVDLFRDKESGYRALLSALHLYATDKQNKSSKFSNQSVQPFASTGTNGDTVTGTGILPGMRLGLDPKDSINRIVINDRAKERIEDDRLNFAPYVRALYEFIKAPETTTPLAISINGAWGTGKSSLMSMLMQELEPAHRNRWQMHWQGLAWLLGRKKPFSTLWLSRLLLRLGGLVDEHRLNAQLALIAERKRMPPPYHPTVWFNAWKFSQEEQIWSALALEVLNQLNHKKYSLLSRLHFWSHLTLKRSRIAPAIGRISLNLLPTIILVLGTFLYKSYFVPLLHQVFPQIANITVANAGETTLGIAALVSLFITSFKAMKVNPFKLSTKELLDSPNYQDKVGYISQFDKDFKNIVNVVTGLSSSAWEAQKLVIFIDDLDRCPYLQAAGIIEAISLFLDSEQCVFVLGMDLSAIATSIEAKYKELSEKIRHDKPDVVSPGSLFLDKIVQIVLNIPQAQEQYINALVEDLTHLKNAQLSQQRNTQFQQMSVNHATSKMAPQNGTSEQPNALLSGQVTSEYFRTNDVQQAMKYAGQLLNKNPRQVKRFVNLFRLKIVLADQQRILTGQEEDLVDFAVAIAWSMKWADVAKLVLYGDHSREVCTYLLYICQNLEEDGRWKQQKDINNSLSSINLANQIGIISPIDQIIDNLSQERQAVEKFPSHWYYLPWEEWIYDKDFRHCLMRLKAVWQMQVEEHNSNSSDGRTLNLIKLMKL